MSFAVLPRFRMTVGRKIYALIGLGFLGLLGITFLDSRELASSLKQQRKLELQHLGELAIGIVKEEYATVQKDGVAQPEAKKRAIARVAALRYGNNDYFSIQDMQSRLVMHPMMPQLNGKDMSQAKDPDGKLFAVEMTEVVKQKGSGFVAYSWPRPGADKPLPKLSFIIGFAPWEWTIITGAYVDDMNAQVWASAQRSLIAAGLVLLLTLAVSMFVARGVTTPLQRITAAMKQLAGGKLDVEVPGVGRHDEIGEMAEAVQVFKSNAVARLGLEAEQKEAETRAVARRKADMHKLADDFEGAVGENYRDGFFGFLTARNFGWYAHLDRGTGARTRNHGRGSVRGSLHQCAVGGLRHRGDGVVG